MKKIPGLLLSFGLLSAIIYAPKAPIVWWVFFILYSIGILTQFVVCSTWGSREKWREEYKERTIPFFQQAFDLLELYVLLHAGFVDLFFMSLVLTFIQWWLIFSDE